jgi:hypothetical protein
MVTTWSNANMLTGPHEFEGMKVMVGTIRIGDSSKNSPKMEDNVPMLQ